MFPYSFYDLSPVLLAIESVEEAPFNFVNFFFAFLLPFSWSLWGCILALFVLVGVLDGLVDDKLPAWGESNFFRKTVRTTFVGSYAGLMSFVASGGLGYNGEIGSNNFSGNLLRTIWALVIWILKAGYTAQLASAILLASLAAQTTLSAKSFDDLVAKHQVACVRDGTAVTSIL